MELLAANLSEGFGNVLFFGVFGAIFVFLNLFVIGKLIMRRPHRPGVGQKGVSYECGEPTIGDAWIRFDIRFYTLALIFLVFDIEVAILFPWATVFDSFVEAGQGLYGFLAMFFFLGILAVGLAYDWAKRDLEWTSTLPGRAVSEEALQESFVADREPAAAAGKESAA